MTASPQIDASRRLPPGPPGRGIRNLIARIRDYAGFLQDMTTEYGGIVRFRILSKQFYAVSDPALLHEVFVTRRASFEKGPAYKKTNFLTGPTSLTGDGDDHRRRRKLIQPSFHKRALAGYAEIMVEEAEALQRRWADGRTVNLAEEMRRVALAIAVRAFFGRDSTVDPDLIRDTLGAILWGMKLSQLPFTDLLNRLPLPHNLRARRIYGRLDEQIFAVIDKARRGGEARTDLISLLVGVADEEDGALGDDEIRDETYVIIFAGHETATAALSWVFHHLSRNPAVLGRVRQELDEVLGGRAPTLEDYDRLTYLRAVFSETLRLSPPIYFVGRRAIEDCTIGEYFVPAGTVVQPCIRVPQVDARNFPDPDRFDPERWLRDDDGGRNRYGYLPFGVGSRTCAGEAFARVEAAMVLASLLQNWDFEPLSDAEPRLDTFAGYLLRDGLPVRLSQRRPGPDEAG